jgi:peptidoglycan/xylan/chitin deacetylase (PgdA/CDA1 family)
MAGNVSVGVRLAHLVSVLLGLAAATAARPALAADCPRADALGISRTLVVDAKAHPLIGSMQYRETLPLNDGEVVLTFDDGPLGKHSEQVLEILAGQCVKATFFLVGRQAQANPEGVRKVRDAGHTVATHTLSHPYAMQRMALDRAKAEIDGGIAQVTAALGEGAVISPFFRIPGLARNDGIEEYTREKGLQVWSADVVADDWHHISAQRVHDLAMQRITARGKGVMLFHDIQPRTVAALPKILADLKARGFRIVHVVPATQDNPATPTEPQQWRQYPNSELIATARWPKITTFAFVQHEPLPAPKLTDSYWNDTKLLDRPQARGRGIPLPRQAPWPRQVQIASVDAPSALPAPAASVFEVEEGLGVVLLGVNATRPAERRVATETEPKKAEPKEAEQREAEPKEAEAKKPEPRKPQRSAARKGKRPVAVARARGKPAAEPLYSESQSAAAQNGRTAAAARRAVPEGKRALPEKKNVKRAIHHNRREANAQPPNR